MQRQYSILRLFINANQEHIIRYKNYILLNILLVQINGVYMGYVHHSVLHLLLKIYTFSIIIQLHCVYTHEDAFAMQHCNFIGLPYKGNLL